MVVVLVLLALPLGLDSWQRSAAISARVAVGYWLWRPTHWCVGIEDTRVGVVEVALVEWWRSRPLAQAVASLGCDVGEDVGTDVPAAEGVQIPIRLDHR